MLVLTRNTGETLKIGDEVTITILGTKDSQVKIGIDAPKDVDVHREEIYQRIQQEGAWWSKCSYIATQISLL